MSLGGLKGDTIAPQSQIESVIEKNLSLTRSGNKLLNILMAEMLMPNWKQATSLYESTKLGNFVIEKSFHCALSSQHH